MRTLALIGLALLATGCAGTMLDGRFCTLASNDTIKQDIAVIADSVVDNKKEAVRTALQVANLSATALCEAARYKAAKE